MWKLWVGLLVFVVAFAGGWKTRDAFCDAAALRVQLESRDDRIKELELTNKVINQANNLDAVRAMDAARAAALAKGNFDEIVVKIDDGVCFTPDDSAWVRQLWGRAQK